MSELLDKNAILSKRATRDAFVKAFGGRVRVVELTSGQRDAMDVFIVKTQKARGEDAARALYTSYWVMFATVDGEGKRVFSDEDLDAVSGLPAADLRRVYRTIARLNGVGEDDEEEPADP